MLRWSPVNSALVLTIVLASPHLLEVKAQGKGAYTHCCVAMNCSIHPEPFTSSLLLQKQEGASLNSLPQGPLGIPPRQGHFELFSPLGRINP